jgi:hypothetical protein
MHDNNEIIQDFDGLLRQALFSQAKANEQIEKANQELANSSENDLQTLIHIHQLTLSYRLDTQNIIKSLLSFNQGLCQTLGIEPQNDFVTNMERAAFALGTEELDQDFALLRELFKQLRKTLELSEKVREKQKLELEKLDKLLKKLGKKELEAASEEEDEENELEHKHEKKYQREKRYPKLRSAERALMTALDLQVNFAHSIDQLTEALQVFGNIPKFGLIYDYLAGLKGPISRFHLALQNGIGNTTTILTLVKLKLGVDATKANSNQLVHQFSTELAKNTATQKQLLQQTHNQIKQLNDITNNLSNKKQVQHAPKHRVQDDAVAKRMLNLFNRQ